MDIDTLHRVYAAAAPKLIELNWKEFFPNIELTDGDGNRKYQGCFFRVGEIGKQYGFLPDLAKSDATLERKFAVIESNPIIQSIHKRDPGRGIWGGAIRMEQSYRSIAGVTGWPELVDHISIAYFLENFNLLPVRYSLELLHWNSNHVCDAREFVGMNEYHYRNLLCKVYEIMMDAHYEVMGVPSLVVGS